MSIDESIKLAPLQEALLSEDTLDQIFFDLAYAAELIEIVVKNSVEIDASSFALTLAQARQLLRERKVLGIQLRYRYHQAEWWDTFMCVENGIRLIRIEQQYTI